jgi:hypothetical protein
MTGPREARASAAGTPRTSWFSLAAAGLATLVFIGSAGAQQTEDPPAFALQRPTIRTGEPIFQFNGRDLTGFTTFLKGHGGDDPNRVFTVQDGVLRISGQDFGAVTTAESYSNYLLTVEWRWGTATWPPREKAARDSGILVHCVGPDGASGGMWMQSIECQIIEGGCGDLILVPGKDKPRLTVETRTGRDGQLYFEPSGEASTRDSGRFNWWGRDPAWKDVLGFRGRRDVEKPAGDWNLVEVVCRGDTITPIVNGLVVNAGRGASQLRGKIQFQSEGAEILIRRIEIRPLLDP